MQCKNAKEKTEEAQFWLDGLIVKEVYDDEKKYSYYLHAYLVSVRSILDYIVGDFLNSLTPKISVIEWKRARGKKKPQNRIIEKHPQKEKIEKFFELYNDALRKLRSDPLVYYFLEIRDEIIHHRKVSEKGMTITSTNPQTQESTKMRTLEMPFNEEGLEKYPRYKIEYPPRFTKEQIIMLEQDIRHTDAKIHLVKYFHKITEFKNKFEKLDIDYALRNNTESL